MQEDRMLYFAYGSNLDWTQMRSRCASAQFVAIASLPDYSLCFPRYSRSRRGDVASIVPAAGDLVWGVVHRLDETDRYALDAAEGFRSDRHPARNSYQRVDITVLKHGHLAEPLDVFTYIAQPQPNFGPCGPSDEYRALILSGARYWGLPAEYLRSIERVSETPRRSEAPISTGRRSSPA
jgi:gamma-glutamylcyclotransferase